MLERRALKVRRQALNQDHPKPVPRGHTNKGRAIMQQTVQCWMHKLAYWREVTYNRTKNALGGHFNKGSCIWLCHYVVTLGNLHSGILSG